MTVKTKAQHIKASEKVFALMNKGEQNLTKGESAKILRAAKAIQAYKQKL